ncbi:MAG: DNA polymerase III subunit delta' [Pseudomonadota bacterium]
MHPWNQAHFTRLMADRSRLPHALLLHGPAGVGKLELSRALAQGLLCEQPGPQGQACGVCDACNWFEQGNHPDFRLLQPGEAEAESAGDEPATGAESGKVVKRALPIIKVDSVRTLTRFTQLSTHRGGWRVAIIEPAEAMNGEAANALLKTLEEPPAGVLLILVTHRIGRLLPTVLSRCRKIHVGLPGTAEALAWLESAGLANAAPLLAEAGGAPLVAMAYGEDEHISLRDEFLDQLASGPALDACSLAQGLKGNHDRVWGWLLRWVLDLMNQRLAGQPRYFVLRSRQTAGLAEKLDLAALLHFHRELLEAGRWLRHPLNSQLLIESWLVRYLQLTGGRA